MIIQSDVKLHAVYTNPDETKQTDAFLIIPGSGKVNHLGNVGKLKPNIYFHLSDYLNWLGYATLRYDKRGVGESEGDYYKTGVKDLLKDIDAMVQHLKSLKEIKNIYLIGHSEGCILSTVYAMNHSVDGLILIAGAGTTLKTALYYQNIVASEEISQMRGPYGWLLKKLMSKQKLIDKQQKLFNKLAQSNEDMIKIQFMKFNAKWFREHFEYTDSNILQFLKTTTTKILAITGDKDVQANSNDLTAINRLNNPNVTTKVIKNMDHLMHEHMGKKSILKLKKQYKNATNDPLHQDLFVVLKDYIQTVLNSQ
jgi:pimeloyl-ACP methyl ester carboxylesterase